MAFGSVLELKLSGSKDPNSRVLGPKILIHINGIWALNPTIWGPWTLFIIIPIYIYVYAYPYNPFKGDSIVWVLGLLGKAWNLRASRRSFWLGVSWRGDESPGFRGWSSALSLPPKPLRTHNRRLFGPKDHTVQGFWAFFKPWGLGSKFNVWGSW